MLDDHRELYNAALEERREAWRRAEISISFYDQDAQLKDIRRERPEFARWACHSERETIHRLDRAFQAFYRRCKAGEKPGYPRFRGRERFNSITWPEHGNGCRWLAEQQRVYLRGVGQVRVHAHRLIEGRVKTVTAKREGRRWYLVLSCDQVPTRPLASAGAEVGIDLGVVTLVATSDGELLANPRHLARSAAKLTKTQQVLARKRRGSNRRRKARAQVAAAHQKIREQRRDLHHKTALALVHHYDLICHEALMPAAMSRSARGTIGQPGRNVAAKAGLNRSIRDAGWGQFLTVLHDKAACAGREVVAVNPRHTSQMCSSCGHVASESRVTQAAFRCVACGFEANADVNAAVNILRAGLALRERSREVA
jgi:putative transposase